MDWPEIKRRLTKEGTSVQILADLEGVPYKTMYQRIKWHERQDGKKYMPEMKAKKKEKRPEVVQDIPEVIEEIMDMGNQRARIIDGRKLPDVAPEIPEEVYTQERKLMPETIEEILAMYKQCCELADRYTKQAEDWARIMDVMQMEERERIRRT